MTKVLWSICYFNRIPCHFEVQQPANCTGVVKQGKSEGFHRCDRPSNLTQTGFKSLIFQVVWPWNLRNDLKKIEHLFNATSIFVHDFKSFNEFKLELQSRNAQFVSKLVIILSHVTLKFDGRPRKIRAPLLYYIKLWALFQIHRWIQTGVIVRTRSNQVKIDDFF